MTHVKQYTGLMEPGLAKFSEISVMCIKGNNTVHACNSREVHFLATKGLAENGLQTGSSLTTKYSRGKVVGG